MGLIPFDLGGGIITNLISDPLAEALSQFSDRRSAQAFLAKLNQYELDFEQAHDGSIATQDRFYNCLQTCRVMERILSHILNPDPAAPTEAAFLATLEAEMTQSLERSPNTPLSPLDRQVIQSFLSEIFGMSKDFVTQKASERDRRLLYELYQNGAEIRDVKELLQTESKKSDAILNTMQALLQSQEYLKDELPPEFDDMIRSCNETLRKARNRIDVYSMNKLDFDSVYVHPNLALSHYQPDISCGSSSFLQSAFHQIHIKNSNTSQYLCENWMNYFPSYYDFSSVYSAQNIFALNHIIYIIGGAGYGKSLFLRNLEVNPGCLPGFEEKPLLVLSGDIKKLVRSDGNLKPMRTFLEECFANNSLSKPDELCPDFLTRCLKAGRCLILLDALDEVGNDKREPIHNLIIDYFKKHSSGNKVCITSRDRGFIPCDQIICFRIEPITREDISKYVDNFIALDRFDREEKDHFVEQASVLADKGFVKGFLTLSLLMAIYKNEQELPANKVLLYEKCFEYMANTREKGKRLLRNSETNEFYDWSVLGHFMQDATFMGLAQLSCPNNADIAKGAVEDFLFNLYKPRFFHDGECREAIEQFLQFCVDRTEVFVPSANSNDHYKFYHRSFYEYFYAKHIELHTHMVADTYKALTDFGPDSEVFELLVTLYTQHNPGYLRELLDYAFQQVQPTLGARGTHSPFELNILVMLMQTATDIDFIRQFISLFLTPKNQVSRIRLDVAYSQIRSVFARDPDYFEQQFQEHQQGLLLQIERELIGFLSNSSSPCSKLLSRIKKLKRVSLSRYSRPGFTYTRSLSQLPNRNKLIEDCFKRLKNEKYLFGQKHLNHTRAQSVLKFSTKILDLSVEQRALVYDMLPNYI